MSEGVLADIPLSLYLHFPWCVRKCPYCDFNSHHLRGEIPEDAYVNALLRDLDWELATFPHARRPLQSIFMGGGTPSLFSGAAITRVLAEVQKRLAFAPDIEITLEANPGTAEAQNFREYRAGGVNRLSMGVQSLNDAHLKRLGRIHNADEVRAAYRAARDAGFDNINLDLMFALPQQTPQEAEADIRGLIALQPEHISYYQLTLEPNTEFAARPPPVPDDDTAWEIQETGQRLLADAGYRQYEISAYAKGAQARHNLNYWEFGDYLGIGAGAHGKLSSHTDIQRRARHKHPKTYLETAGTAACLQEKRQLLHTELPFEFMMNVLRLCEGVATPLFQQRTGLTLDAAHQPVQAAIKLGLLDLGPERITPTVMGQRHLNRLLGLFLEP